MLPERSHAAEDAFIDGLFDAAPDHLLMLVEEAIAARRVQLAGRVAQLIDLDQLDAEPDGPLAKALVAARYLLHVQLKPEEVSWAELDEAMSTLRDRWMDRARRRTRRRLRPEAGDMLGLGAGSHRRRKR